MARPFGPWFRRRPHFAGSVAVCLFLVLALLGIDLAHDRVLVAVALVFPVALLAVTFGRRGGLAGGVGGTLLYAALAVTGVGMDKWTGLAAAAALLLIGTLLGDAVDEIEASDRRARMSEQARERAEQAAERQGRAAEVNDSIVQGVAVAKWALEAGDAARALTILDDTVGAGQRMVSDLLGGRVSDAGEPHHPTAA